MTRVTDAILARSNLSHISLNRELVAKYGNQVDTGLAVTLPGDSDQSAVIAQYQTFLKRLDGYTNTSSSLKGFLNFQEDSLAQAGDLINRAKELATEGANETISPTNRAALAQEVYQIRDQMVAIANGKYQGNYVWNGAANSTPPYSALTYTNPPTGEGSQRYTFGGVPGSSLTNSVNVTDDVSVRSNTPGNQIFDGAIQALERLGRSLEGYKTTLTGGVPDGGGVAYNQPSEYSLQSSDIQATIDLLETARSSSIETERVSVSSREQRVETAESLLALNKDSAEKVLERLQNADIAVAASKLQQSQTSLQASLLVSTRVQSLNILDYL